jgi:hypothetical protein
MSHDRCETGRLEKTWKTGENMEDWRKHGRLEKTVYVTKIVVVIPVDGDSTPKRCFAKA